MFGGCLLFIIAQACPFPAPHDSSPLQDSPFSGDDRTLGLFLPIVEKQYDPVAGFPFLMRPGRVGK